MKNNLRTRHKLLSLMILMIVSMPVAVSAQTFWDYFTLDYWYSTDSGSTTGDPADPNDDKKKKSEPVAPTSGPAPAPEPEQCFEGVIPVPCPTDSK